MNLFERIILRKELTSMFERIFSHWKTTAAGIGVAVLQVILNGRTTKEVAVALAAAIVGALAKD